MKVIATDIQNLTDARYFAAWHVDTLCYTLDDGSGDGLSAATIKEIAGWVEGPDTAIKISGLAIPTELSALSDDLQIDSLILGPFIDQAELSSHQDNIYRICTLQDGWQESEKLVLTLDTPFGRLTQAMHAQIKSLAETKEIFIDGAFAAPDLPAISSLGVAGIILKGGEEEKVGYKSFDELDEILETLFEE